MRETARITSRALAPSWGCDSMDTKERALGQDEGHGQGRPGCTTSFTAGSGDETIDGTQGQEESPSVLIARIEALTRWLCQVC